MSHKECNMSHIKSECYTYWKYHISFQYVTYCILYVTCCIPYMACAAHQGSHGAFVHATHCEHLIHVHLDSHGLAFSSHHEGHGPGSPWHLLHPLQFAHAHLVAHALLCFAHHGAHGAAALAEVQRRTSVPRSIARIARGRRPTPRLR